MATWDDVRAAALELPEVEEDGTPDAPGFRVRGKSLANDRPLRRRDLQDLAAAGVTPPDGSVLAVRVPDLEAKDALLAALPGVCFTTPHFDGYATVLVRLADLDPDELPGLLTDAWLSVAPRRLLAQHPELSGPVTG
ncbi:MmcQ/YjbR family DNA-binding protein [Angustibacter aerolatus]